MPIWPFRSRQPRLQDQAFADLARMFLSDPDDPTPGSESLDVRRFDFTVDSLGAVDAHLEGAYVGEVIRRHSTASAPWHWVEYDEAVRLDPRLAAFDKSLGNVAALWEGHDGFCFPLAKVGKYLENGSEDSVKFFAQAIIAGPPPRA